MLTSITRESKYHLLPGFGVFNDILRRTVCDVPTDMVRPARYTGEILKRTIVSSVKPTVHTYLSRKWRFSKTLFKPEKFENACLSFTCGPGNVLKTQLFENDDMKIIKRFLCLSFTQTNPINKLTSVFLCVCPVIDHEFRHHIVKVAVDPRGDSRVDPQTTLTML